MSPEVLEKLHRHFDDSSQPPVQRVVEDIANYVVVAFQEMWDELYQPYTSADWIRLYTYDSDDAPDLLFLGRLVETILYDFAIVEEVVEIYDVELYDDQR